MVVKMKNIITFIKMCFFPVLIMSPLLAKGHHSFAMFDSSQFMLVEGTVLRWNFNSPHSWLYIVVINPIRTGAASGAICFAQKEDDLIVRPNNNSTCDSVGIAARWTEEGWLENAAHLESHPAN
jgi:hypothetical protein